MKKDKSELLAPAGSPEAFYGAIRAGADAVYLAGKSFGARAYADNFTEEDLKAAIRFAHLYGRKVYLTVNTLVKESEMTLLPDFLSPYYEEGLDGVIVQDLGVIRLLRECFPDLALHASTQLSVTGPKGAELLASLGVTRIVPARELSLKEVLAIKRQTGLEMECFIHGALCYSYSGQCLFSSMLGGRSGNRGRCAQPCRLPYCGSYPLSLKDLNTSALIPELLEAGIDSFKIEGRMKSPEYVAGVTGIYRNLIDRIRKGDFAITEREREMLASLYVRGGVSDGYYHRRNGAEMISGEAPGYRGQTEQLLEEIRRQYLEPAGPEGMPKRKVSFSMSLLPGEPARLTAISGDYAVQVSGETVQEAQNRPISEEDVLRGLCKLGHTVFSPEEEKFRITLQGKVFYSLKGINEIRRRSLREIEDCIIASYGLVPSRSRTGTSPARPESNGAPRADKGLFAGPVHEVLVSTKEQLGQVLASDCLPRIGLLLIEEALYLSGDTTLFERELEDYRAGGGKVFLALCRIRRAEDARAFDLVTGKLPSVIRGKNAPLVREIVFDGALIRNLEDLWDLCGMRRSGALPEDFCLSADHSIYLWNAEAIRLLRELADRVTLPLELSGAECGALMGPLAQAGFLSSEISRVIYGRCPLMVTANCVQKTLHGCIGDAKQHLLPLQDRYRKEFPVRVDCLHCLNLIYNSVPSSLHKNLGHWVGKSCLRLELSTEDGKETEAVLNFYVKERTGGGRPPLEYTTGYESRPVE